MSIMGQEMQKRSVGNTTGREEMNVGTQDNGIREWTTWDR